MSDDNPPEFAPLQIALRARFKAHQIAQDDIPNPPPTDPQDLAALINDRVATALTITAWDRLTLPVELHVPKAQIPAAFATEEIKAAAADLNKARQRFLKTLQRQLTLDAALLDQKLRGQLRELAQDHAKAEHAQRLDELRRRNQLKLDEQREEIERELIRYERLQQNAAKRSARLAAKARLKLTRKLEWQKDYLSRKKLQTQIRRNALRIQLADEYSEQLEQIERDRQEEIVRVAREQKESFIADLEAEAILFNERKLEAARIEKFTLTKKQQARLDKAKLKLEEQRAAEAERKLRLEAAEARRLKAEHGIELAKEAFLNKRTLIHNLRELNAIKAERLQLDSRKPLTAWKAAEQRARELGLSTTDLATAANDETEIPAVTPASKEQMK